MDKISSSVAKRLAKADNIYRWAAENLKPRMAVKFLGSRSHRWAGQYRIVDRVILKTEPKEIWEFRNDDTGGSYLSGTANRVVVVSHNAFDRKDATGRVVTEETTTYAENDAEKLSRIRINGKWTPVSELITKM